MSTTTAQVKDTIRTTRNGSLDSRLFLIAVVLVGLWYIGFQDWSPLESVRLQSPITFVLPDQSATPTDIAHAAAAEAGLIPNQKGQTSDALPPTGGAGGGGGGFPEGSIATAAQFDLTAVAKAENIELDQEDLTLDEARQQYIRRYSPVAIAEMRKFGIPASITIAQGLLETRAGQSGLAKKNNNHFGMKCFSKRCGKGHCSNFTDDTHKDFFLKFPSAWASYRAHSKLLRSGRYANIQGDYRDWARGLKKAGYATAPNYAESLIRLIRLYGLDRLDKM